LPENPDDVKTDLLERQKKRRQRNKPDHTAQTLPEHKMSARTLHQVQQEGLNILVVKLGPDDAIRFLRIYETGSGDWTEDRKKSWRKTRIRSSKASWSAGRKFPLREILNLFF
jgi:hypothetical protein